MGTSSCTANEEPCSESIAPGSDLPSYPPSGSLAALAAVEPPASVLKSTLTGRFPWCNDLPGSIQQPRRGEGTWVANFGAREDAAGVYQEVPQPLFRPPAD